MTDNHYELENDAAARLAPRERIAGFLKSFKGFLTAHDHAHSCGSHKATEPGAETPIELSSCGPTVPGLEAAVARHYELVGIWKAEAEARGSASF